ncbi:MAG: Two-component transcriptional regulator, CheY-like receiver domain [Marmoricola sp.]|nr:Two-component transcriptional regulator, CheY-like receiver domain [Marmoricola sp.]
MRGLVVEDDIKLARSLRRGLALDGYNVTTAATGDEGLALASTTAYDAILLDVMLPGVDGFALCQTLRASEVWTPVLMLTARTAVSDRIRGLDGGADDYVVKPFDFDELRARLRVLVRRGPTRHAQLLQVGTMSLDPAARLATRKGHQIELTEREFDVLEALAQHAGRPVSREALLAEVWNEDPDVSPNVVDVYIGYLRKKLERPKGPRLIRTVRGKGFVLEPL